MLRNPESKQQTLFPLNHGQEVIAGDSTAHTPCQQPLRAVMSADLLPINCPDLNLSQLQDSSLHHLVAQKRIYTNLWKKGFTFDTRKKKRPYNFLLHKILILYIYIYIYIYI